MGCGCRGGGRSGGRRTTTLMPISNNPTTISNQSTRNNISIQAQGEVKINGMTKAQREEERRKRVQSILKQRRNGLT